MRDHIAATATAGRHGADASERLMQEVRRDAQRRSDALPHIRLQIEASLKRILSTPVLQQDARCQNIVARIARAGTMVDFADRVGDLQRYVRHLAGQRDGCHSLGNAQQGGARIEMGGVKTRTRRHRIQI